MKAPKIQPPGPLAYAIRQTILAGVLLCTVVAVSADTVVTFQVDMSVARTNGIFNPSTQSVTFRDSFHGWGPGPLLLTNNPIAANSNLYTGTYNFATNGLVLEYKFVLEPGPVWETNDNRAVAFPSTNGAVVVLPVAYFGDIPPGPAPTNAVTFQVDMAQQIFLGNFTPGTSTGYCRGSFNDWSLNFPLTNNPSIRTTNAYGVVSSNVYVGTYGVVAAPGATVEYKFYIAEGDNWENPPSGAPGKNWNRFFTLANGSQTLPVVYFNDAPYTLTTNSGIFTNGVESFELGFNGWATDNPAIWEVGLPTYGPPTNALGLRAHSGTNCAATVLGGDYPDERTSRLVSPPFVVPAADQLPRLRFWHWWNISANDQVQVQIKVGTNAWQALSEVITADSSGRWTRAWLDLTPFAGQTVQLGFYFESHQTYYGYPINGYRDTVAPGWYVDDLLVETGPLPAFALPGQPDGFEAGWGGWRADYIGGQVTDFAVWEIGVPTYGPPTNALGLRAHSGTNCAATVLAGDYLDDRTSRLVSPAFVVPVADQLPRLRFWHWWNIGADDQVQVQIKLGTNAWQVLSEVITADSSGQWIRAWLDLAQFAGQTVQLGLYFESHQTYYGYPYFGYFDTVAPGWYVDDLLVETGPLPPFALLGQTEGFEGTNQWERWSVTAGTWEIGSPTYGPPPNTNGNRAFAGTNVAATILDGNYEDWHDSRLVSSTFVLPSAAQNPRLRFWHWYSFNCGDYGQVEIRVTNGTWAVLPDGYYGGDNGGIWARPLLDLSAYAGQLVQLAFHFHSEDYRDSYGYLACGSPDVAPGWYVDEVTVVTGAVVSVVANTPDSFEDTNRWDRWWVTAGTWEIGVPTSGPAGAHSGTNVAATILDGNYEDWQDSRLVSSTFVVPSAAQNPRLRFWHWYSFNCADYGQVEIRGTNGTWVVLPDGYYSGDNGGIWERPLLDLSTYAGQLVELAFNFHSEDYRDSYGYLACGSPDVAPGWYVDEVTLRAGPDVFNNPETFEFGWGDWGTDNYGLWQLGFPTSGPPVNTNTGSRAYSPTNVAATLLNANYSANSAGRLISPRFIVPSVSGDDRVILRFWQWYQYGTGDAGVVQVSTPYETSWTTLATAATTGTSSAWNLSTVDLTPYQGQEVRVAFYHIADSDGSVGAGWFIDDVSLSQSTPTRIALNTASSQQFTTNGQSQYFVITAPPGGHLRVRLTDADHLGINEIYVRRGALPTAGSYDYRFPVNGGADQSIFVPNAGAGDWFIQAYNDSGPVPGDYTLQVDFTVGVILDSLSPAKVGNSVPGSVAINGAGFAPSDSVALVGGSVYPASNVLFISASKLVADFNFPAIPTNTYQLRVASGTNSASLPLELIEGVGPNFVTRLIVPSRLGRHAPGTIYVEYANIGDAPVAAPLLVLTGTQRPILRPIFSSRSLNYSQGFWTSAQPLGWSQTVQFLASGATAGIIQPGESNTISIAYAGLVAPWDPFQSTIRFDLGVMTETNTALVDWNSLKDSMRPASIPVETWDVLWGNFLKQAGATWGDYVRMLDSSAAYLRNLGLDVKDLESLLAFSFAQADGLNVIRTLASSTDAYVSTPGLRLSFERFFPQSISGRYRTNALGRGWAHNWESSLAEAGDGTVTVTGPGGSRRVFQPDSRYAGVYFSEAGDHGTLAKSGGIYTLTEPRGLNRVFASDGKLSYVEDPNGNRITTTFSGGLLTKLTHSAGQTLTLSYSGNVLQSVTDSFGRATTFSYDGQHLQTAAYYDGASVSYSYASGLGAAREHALTQIAYPGGTHEFFSYDANGRLATLNRDGGAEALTFGYEGGGLVGVTDAFSNKTCFYLDHRGLLAKVQNPFTDTLILRYDTEFNLTSLTDPAGRSYEYGYDSNGNLLETADPLGVRTHFGYGALSRLATLTDARGNLTRYTHDAKGNLSAITYANNSVERWGYDAIGNPITWTNRRANGISYVFNTNGQLTAKLFSDGSRADYAYDARGNLIFASNYVGAITLDYYTNDRLRRITYPGSRWLEYTYDVAGRRTTMTDQLDYTSFYNYDAAGRLMELTNNAGTRLVLYEYDTAGRLWRKTLGNGVYTTNAFDAAGQLVSLVNRKPDGSLLSRFDYTYDARGRRTVMATHYGTWTYGYDDLGQLTNAVLVSTDTNIPNQNLTYIYDALGNRIRTIENAFTTDYTANNLNQYTQIGAMTLKYDGDGSLTQKVEIATTLLAITNSFENRITGFGSTNGQHRFDYDALGFPTVVWRSGLRTFQIQDPFGWGDFFAAYDDSGLLVERQIHGLGAIATITNGAPTFLTFDAIGNVSDLADGSSLLISSLAFRPFGQQIRVPTETQSGLGFGGEYGLTKEGELLSIRARFYDSVLGRFTAPDPLGDWSSEYSYSFALNDPVNAYDPLGLDTITIKWPNQIVYIFGWTVKLKIRT